MGDVMTGLPSQTDEYPRWALPADNHLLAPLIADIEDAATGSHALLG